MSNNREGSGEGQGNPGGGAGQKANLDHVLKVARTAMEQQQVPKEVQEEALRAISNAASQAGMVDSAQLAAISRSAELRATFFAEALRQAESAEERQRYVDDFLRADERDSRERYDAGERSTNTQRGIARIGGRVLGVLALGAGAAAAGAASAWAASRK